MGSLVTLVNDNHMDKLKEILAFVYHGSIVNIRPKKTSNMLAVIS